METIRPLSTLSCKDICYSAKTLSETAATIWTTDQIKDSERTTRNSKRSRKMTGTTMVATRIMATNSGQWTGRQARKRKTKDRRIANWSKKKKSSASSTAYCNIRSNAAERKRKSLNPILAHPSPVTLKTLSLKTPNSKPRNLKRPTTKAKNPKIRPVDL